MGNPQPRAASGYYAILIGLFLLAEGIWGMNSPMVFGVLSTNTTHAVIHILLGITGIALGFANKARGYCLFLGVLLLVVGVFRFIPGISDIVVQLFNVNYPVAYLNIAVGAISLFMGFQRTVYVKETK